MWIGIHHRRDFSDVSFRSDVQGQKAQGHLPDSVYFRLHLLGFSHVLSPPFFLKWAAIIAGHAAALVFLSQRFWVLLFLPAPPKFAER
ncbi:MAG: hypothetical protein KAV00_13340 [Phycisphaerae bacterium]|nr:hypothetical protein [Phycisphaerae bacterium]